MLDSPEDGAIPRDDIDALLRFMPTLGTAGPDAVVERDETSLYPTYTKEVKEFCQVAGRSPWRGHYRHRETGTMFHDDAAIESATLDDIRSMLTFCVRGERFSDDFWGTCIRTGRIGAILRRLLVLRDSVA